MLAFLPCKTGASVAGWQHLHTPELRPSLYHPYTGIQVVGLRSVWEVHEEPSWMEAEGWSPLARFGDKCDFFYGQDVCLIGAIAALPRSTTSSSHGRPTAWWGVTRQMGQGNNERYGWQAREGFGHCFIFRCLPWVVAHKLCCSIFFQHRTIFSLWLHGLTWILFRWSALTSRGKVLFSEVFRGKSICCKNMIKLEDLKGLNIKCCLELALVLSLGPGCLSGISSSPGQSTSVFY